MKISAIKQQVKNTERASIFVDGKYSFSLSLDELVAERLSVGRELDEPELKRLKRLSDEGKLKNRALAWVLNRPHSEREFRDYLRRKKADADLIQAWVEDFTEKKYLNDAAYAIWLSEYRRSRGKSGRAIRSELQSKGVTQEIIAEVLENGDDELTALKQLVEKKQNLPRYKVDQQKFMVYLASQGFSFDLIKQVLKGDDG